AEIDQFAFQTLDLKPQRDAVGEGEGHDAARRVCLGEFDGKQVEGALLVFAIDVAALDGIDPVEPQRPPTTLEFWIVGQGAFQVEPREADYEPLFGGPPEDIADGQRRVLQMRGNHLYVVPVEGDELEEFHGFLPGKLRSCRN